MCLKGPLDKHDGWATGELHQDWPVSIIHKTTRRNINLRKNQLFSKIFLLLYFQLNDNTTDSRHQLDTYTHRCVCPICLKGCRSSSSLSFEGPLLFFEIFYGSSRNISNQGGPPFNYIVCTSEEFICWNVYIYFFFLPGLQLFFGPTLECDNQVFKLSRDRESCIYLHI